MVWMGPLCRQLPANSPKEAGESPTGFKSCLLKYLKHYDLPILKLWIEYVKMSDFSDVRVNLVTSVPDTHPPETPGSHLRQVGNLLTCHCKLPSQTEGADRWNIIAQASSIASLAQSPSFWLEKTFLQNLSKHKGDPSTPNFYLIFPSRDNVEKSYLGVESGKCLSYNKDTEKKQRWLQKYLHQWKADSLGRSGAMPHIKTYCRVSPCFRKLAWFLLTSANMSMAAWGNNEQKCGTIYVRSYETGVMFFPELFNEEYFEISTSPDNKKEKIFPFMYDLPLTPYESTDRPWTT